MSLRSLFAQNLRQLSATKRSHAHVARALGINRQQFNNYITGKNLPNETVVDKICKYFKVDAAYMFRSDSRDQFDKKIEKLSLSHKNIIGNLIELEINSKKKAFSDGLYYIYFGLNNSQKSIVCSLMATRFEKSICVFRRITRIRRRGDLSSPTVRGVHYGFATVRDGRISLIGFDVFENFTASLLTGVPVVSANILYGGTAMISTGVEFVQAPFAIVAVESGYTIKDAIKNVKVYPLESTKLDSSITNYLLNS
jgi:transcriptional regulator with XRE-family HTH domain